MTTDEVLLHRYSNGGDPAAFRELVDRYAGMVYGIGLRVTGDQHTAEDLCQECFLELARKARTVRANVAGWLHASATSRSLNVLRSRRRRKSREQVVARVAVAATESFEWSELQPLIDRALNGLSDDLRLPIILHYLQGNSQEQVAERLGINQATVSRRLQRGVEQLRNRLRKLGVMTTVAAVTSFFGTSSAQAASTSLAASLAKIGVGGVGVTVAKSTPSGLLPFCATLGAVAGNVLLFLFLKGWVFLLIMVIEFALLARPPAWVRELLRAQAFGRDLAAHPTYPFRRWTWTIPPAHWKQQLIVWSYIAFMLCLVAFGHLGKLTKQPGFVLAFGLMAALFFSSAARLAWRVWTLRRRLPTAADHLPEQVGQWSSWESITAVSIGAVVVAMWLLSIPREEVFALSTGSILVWTTFVAFSGMAVWALSDRWRKRNRGDASIDVAVSREGHVGTKPVARRYHVALIGFWTLTVVVLLSSVILQSLDSPARHAPRELEVYRYTKEGTRVRVEVPEKFKRPSPPKGLPSGLVGTASMGFFFSLLLLQRVVKVRDQLPRPAWLALLAFSVLAVSLGAGMTAYLTWTADTGPRGPTRAESDEIFQRREPVFQPSPSQLDLIRKYAGEMAAITVPDEQLPDGWYLYRYSNGFEFPIASEKRHRKLAINIGLPDVPELESAVASLIRIYMNPFVSGEIYGTCVVYAFCCSNADEARALNVAWGNRGLCKDRLVIFVDGRKGLRAPSLTDQAPIPTLFEHIQKTRSASDRDTRPVPVQTP
jgi:RNA polymerase sigma-70 factor (ECF subfamily)